MNIIYEDSNIIVINKPAGLITHQKNIDDKQPSVVDWVIQNYPELKNVGEPFIASGAEVTRTGIVHRLDKDTSGLMIIAKNNETFFYFKNLFQTRKIRKYYLALVHGQPKEPMGIISSPLGRIGLKRTTKIVGKKLIDQKEAETEYKTIKNYKDFALLELSPKTGRTHQLRVHLNSIGHPITGDLVYGFKKLSPPPELSRLFLHAYKIEFITPDGKALALEADLPEDLQNTLNKLQ
ncbi:MAG: RluA family pseudouridine synthase [bacterium]|nr:RluA family pseudouridine synthase [bacterium]